MIPAAQAFPMPAAPYPRIRGGDPRLDVYNYICAERLGKKYGKFIRINEFTVCY